MKQLLPKLLNRSYSLLFILSFLLSSLGWGQYNTNLIYPAGTTSFTVPCGVTEIYVQVWGAGGGGGKAGANGGSGGGGGGYTFNTYTVAPNQSFSIVVGAGGSGGSGGSGLGGNGGASNFGSGLLIANGGTGGAQNGGTVGTGGTATGGTPSAGTPGVAGTATFGGGGGDNGNGNGGADNQTLVDNVGNIGGTGGGGSGGLNSAGGLESGGAGGDGRIIVSYNGPNAGQDQNLVCGSVSTTLEANSPATGTGLWTVVSGPGTVTTPNSNTSGVTGLTAGNCTVLRWTWSNGVSCPSVNDLVTICVDGTASCNDNPCNAVNISASGTSCSSITINNNGGTPTYNVYEPGCGSYNATGSAAGSEDIWYSVTVPSTGDLIITADDFGGSGLYPNISLYTGSSCSNLTHAGCYQNTSTAAFTMNYTGTPGETVYIRIWDYLDAEGAMSLCAYTTNFAGEGTIMPGDNTFTCGSSGTGIFVDPGGNSNYQNGVSNRYTICPSTPGEYISVNFTSFSLGSGDQLTVINGTNGDPIIGNYTGTTSPGTITSSDASGCLTFWFSSNASGVSTGWLANVSCTTTAGTNNTTSFVTSGNCNGGGGIWACQDGGYPTQNAGTAGVEDLGETTTGCWGAGGEVSSTWFYFQPETSGTLEMTFDGPPGMDYDFAVYGPTTDYTLPCPMGTGDGPIRCSYSGASNPVGIGNGAQDYFEDASGNGWVRALDVQVGETYAMVFNIFQNGNPQPTINIGFGGTALLDCTPIILPSSLVVFEAFAKDRRNQITWVTSTEINSDYFVVERSINTIDWEKVGTVQAAGNSQNNLYYFLEDEDYFTPITYYRLILRDYDGTETISRITSVNRIADDESDFISNLFPNPTSDFATFAYSGNDTKTPLTVQVFNNLGEMVNEVVYRNVYKDMPATLITSNLSNGVYQVRFVQGDSAVTKKLSIIN